MSDQIIITIGREFGTHGHDIGRNIAKKLGIKRYTRNILKEIFSDDESIKEMKKYEEKGTPFFLTRKVRGFTSSIEDTITELEFDYLKKEAEKGESFLLIGRCGNFLFKDNPNAIKIFIKADEEEKIKTVMEWRGVNEKEAKKIVEEENEERRHYHNSHCEIKWGDSEGYDICIDIGGMKDEDVEELLIDYIKMKRGTN